VCPGCDLPAGQPCETVMLSALLAAPLLAAGSPGAFQPTLGLLRAGTLRVPPQDAALAPAAGLRPASTPPRWQLRSQPAGGVTSGEGLLCRGRAGHPPPDCPVSVSARAPHQPGLLPARRKNSCFASCSGGLFPPSVLPGSPEPLALLLSSSKRRVGRVGSRTSLRVLSCGSTGCCSDLIQCSCAENLLTARPARLSAPTRARGRVLTRVH